MAKFLAALRRRCKCVLVSLENTQAGRGGRERFESSGGGGHNQGLDVEFHVPCCAFVFATRAVGLSRSGCLADSLRFFKERAFIRLLVHACYPQPIPVLYGPPIPILPSCFSLKHLVIVRARVSCRSGNTHSALFYGEVFLREHYLKPNYYTMPTLRCSVAKRKKEVEF